MQDSITVEHLGSLHLAVLELAELCSQRFWRASWPACWCCVLCNRALWHCKLWAPSISRCSNDKAGLPSELPASEVGSEHQGKSVLARLADLLSCMLVQAAQAPLCTQH